MYLNWFYSNISQKHIKKKFTQRCVLLRGTHHTKMKTLLTLVVFAVTVLLHVHSGAVSMPLPIRRHIQSSMVASNMPLFISLRACSPPENAGNQTFSIRSATKQVLNKIGRQFVHLHTAGQDWDNRFIFDMENPFFV